MHRPRRVITAADRAAAVQSAWLSVLGPHGHGQVSRWQPAVALSARVSTRPRRWSEPRHGPRPATVSTRPRSWSRALTRPRRWREPGNSLMLVPPATAAQTICGPWLQGLACRGRAAEDSLNPTKAAVLLAARASTRTALARARPRSHARPAGHGCASRLRPVVLRLATVSTRPRPSSRGRPRCRPGHNCGHATGQGVDPAASFARARA